MRSLTLILIFSIIEGGLIGKRIETKYVFLFLLIWVDMLKLFFLLTFISFVFITTTATTTTSTTT